MTPPPQNYQYYLDGELKDDCDGFHILVYHCLYNSNIKCYLLSVNAIGDGHCVLIFHFNNEWYINDYSRIYGGFATSAEAIKYYNQRFQEIYKTKEVVYNCCEVYDYEKGKFHSLKVSKLEEDIKGGEK